MTQLTNDMRRARVLQFSNLLDQVESGTPYQTVCRLVLAVGEGEPYGNLITGMVLHEIGELSPDTPSLRTVSAAFNTVAAYLMDMDQGEKLPEDHRHLQDTANILLCFANLAVPRAPAGGVMATDADPLLRSFARLSAATELPHVADLMKVQSSTLAMRVKADEMATLTKAPLLQTPPGAAGVYGDLVYSASAATTRIKLAQIMRRPTAA
jgi:hypothetical protein